MGMDDPMMLTVFMGIINISFTLVAVFTVEKWGRKPLLISGSLGMALGAFGVAVTFGHAGMELITAASLLIYFSVVHVLLGSYLLGAHRRDFPQHHPWCCSSHRSCLPVDIQFHRVKLVCTHVQHAAYRG